MILLGDALEQLKTLPDESVDMCVTSPPYYGLRNYGTGEWVGGDKECSHNYAALSTRFNRGNLSGKQKSNTGSNVQRYKKICPDCGAQFVDRQLGAEDTPEEYIDNLVCVFSEVRRVLKEQGTLWVNIGDTYNSNAAGNKNKPSGFLQNRDYAWDNIVKTNKHIVESCKPKDLLGIPWMLAFALRADGWYLRQDIIWHKPNPMPESITDRCTKSHEYIFLLSKSSHYYFDADAIKEPTATKDNIVRDRDKDKLNNTAGRSRMGGLKTNNYDFRNKRDVWTIATKPLRDAHFAAFPEDLIEPCILAGCPVGGVVLDPFFGSGTTGRVSTRLNRDYIGIELNPKYIEIAERRTDNVQMDLAGWL